MFQIVHTKLNEIDFVMMEVKEDKVMEQGQVLSARRNIPFFSDVVRSYCQQSNRHGHLNSYQ
jgi:hypothetical protein